MKKKFQIKINKKKLKAIRGETILEIAKRNGIDVPSLCYHPDLEVKGSCRLCLVEIKGRNGLFTSCTTKAEPNMEVMTESLKIKKARKINLELIFAQHREECNDCVWRLNNCQLLKLAKEYNVKINRLEDRKTKYPVYEFGPALLFDSSKCIDCRNCVDMCAKQEVNFLETRERGHLFQVLPSKRKDRDCIYCGQCLVHCPVGAFEGIGEFEDIEKPLLDKDKVVVAQFAPSIRTSIGEEFDMQYGAIVTDKLAAAIRELGFDKVFDTSVGADFTTVEEAGELLEKMKKKTACMTSCCPAWVKFVEFYYPEFIGNLATTRSPQIILGGLIKTYFAKKNDIDPKKIVVVSIMPCVAKKYEITKEAVSIDGMKPVDYVLTTRELARLFKKRKINLRKIKPKKADNPLGDPTGAGVIYGASGGVVESALRTAYFKATGKELKKLEFNQVRGTEGYKRAEIKINNNKVRIAIANGIGNAKIILEELKKNPRATDAIEVMACPGGCIGGGGQPMPTSPEIRKKRAESLYNIDAKKKIRSAHQNPIIKKAYKDFLNSDEMIHKICHTKHWQKKKEVGF